MAPDVQELPPIADLRAVPSSETSIRLQWTPTTDKKEQEAEVDYDVRYGKHSPFIGEILCSTWFDSIATQADVSPAPDPGGSTVSCNVTELSRGARYFFAIKQRSTGGPWSTISNVSTCHPYLIVGSMASINTIQKAIDVAVTNDVVLIPDGEYTGEGNWNLRISDKSIIVRSVNRDPAVCVIDCAASEGDPRRGFDFTDCDPNDSIIEGLAIVGGYAERGGAVFLGRCVKSFTNCTFRGNSASDKGGAVHSGHFQGCFFASNTARWGGAAYHIVADSCVFENNVAAMGGGALRIENPFNPRVPVARKCRFISNTAGGSGGAIAFYHPQSFEIVDCDFIGNIAEIDNGGAVHDQEGGGKYTNCMFVANESGNWGGAYYQFWAHSIFERCLFVDNVSNLGGAIHSRQEGSLSISYCTFNGNMATSRAGGAIALFDPSGAHLPLSLRIQESIVTNSRESNGIDLQGAQAILEEVSCTNIYGNDGGDYVGALTEFEGINGNLNVDPQYCSAAEQDFRLSASSPCADTSGGCSVMGAKVVGCE
jgi:predicted outer membrane repeat protein